MKYTGIVALGLYALVFVLALKRPLVNRWFHSLAGQYRAHHLVALAVTLLAIVHTVAQFAALPREDWGIYLAMSETAISTAWAGLALLLIGVGVSWLSFNRYALWYLLHLMLIPAFFLSAWHGLLMAERNMPMWSLLVMLCTLTLAALIVMWLDKRATSASACSITEIRKISGSITELHLSRPATTTPSGFKAGSVVFLRFEGANLSHSWHPFSIASCRYEADLRLLIKGFGADTLQVAELKPGDIAYVRGPFNEITPDFKKPQVWIAGGVGIAAFAGFWACLTGSENVSVDILHFIKDEADAITAESLGFVHPKANSIRLRTVSEKTNDLTALQNLVQSLSTPETTQFMISGPPKFMRAARQKIRRDGIKRSQIHTEEFTPW